jgi:hypothetical protein
MTNIAFQSCADPHFLKMVSTLSIQDRNSPYSGLILQAIDGSDNFTSTVVSQNTLRVTIYNIQPNADL